MSVRRRPRPCAVIPGIALACLPCGALAAPPAARAATPPAITVSEPKGFDDLTREQTLMVDVYFGGVFRGEANVRVTPGTLVFLDPQALLHLLPDVADSAALESLLAGRPLPTNSGMACSQSSDRQACGRLFPEAAGIIFDRDRFRVDVFLNPRFLAVHDNVAERYLPAPGGGISAVNAIGGLYSGQSGKGDDYYNLFDHLLIGNGERRLRAELSVASKVGTGVESLAFEWDRPERRYSVGEFWTHGNDVFGRRKLLGAGIATQIDTRRDKDQAYGSPIVVYLDRRARVDVVRDGRVLSSAIYDSGNQQIDTADLPDGSYNIVLRIQEAGQPAREERRFFTKSQRIPALGRTDYFAYGGMLVTGTDSGSLEPSRHPYFEVGVSHRLNRHWALEGNVEATDRAAAGEAGATFITSVALIRAVAVADTEGTVGGIVQLASTGNSRFNFNFDVRKIDSGRATSGGLQLSPPSVVTIGSPYLAQSVTSYSQASGYISYSVANLRIVGTGVYRKEAGDRTRYSVGPSIEWDMLRKGPFRLALHGDFARTESGNAAYAGISLELRSGRVSLTAEGGGRTSTIADDEIGKGPMASIGGNFETHAAGGELELGAGYQHQPRLDDVILSSEFRHPVGTLSGEFVRSATDLSKVSQYTAAFQTTVTAGGGTIHVAGKTTTESMILAEVDGARPGDRFEVLVNEQVVGTIEGRHALSVDLPAYRAYEVRIRPTGADDLLAYDSSVRSVGLYPGIVSKLRWTSSPMTMKFGHLVGADGSPLRGASITGKGVWGETDDRGDFEIEAPDNAVLTVTTKEGRSYSIALPGVAAGSTIARLGTVVCCQVDKVQLGARDLVQSARERGTP